MIRRNIEEWFLPVVALTTILVFSRGLVDAFELPKATVLWITAPGLLVAAIAKTLNAPRKNLKFVWCLWVLMIAQTLSWVTGIGPLLSSFGAYQRNLGLITIIAVLSFSVNLTLASKVTNRNVVFSIALGGSLHSLYGTIQAWGHDPWEWSSPGQNQPIFGTMGNLNTASFLSAVALILALTLLHKSENKLTTLAFSVMAIVNAAAIGWFDSFQGQVGLLIGVLSLITYTWSAPASTAMRYLLLAGFVGSLGFTKVSPEVLFVVVVVVCGLSTVRFQHVGKIHNSETKSLSTSPRYIQLSLLFGLGLGALAFLGLQWEWITRELDASLLERKAFFSSAISNWRDHWIAGFGQDVFGLVYSIHRPAWHATSYEVNRTNSPHSIWLDFLLSGGVISAIPVILLIVLSGRTIFREVRSKESPNIGLTAAFFAVVLMAGVSVGHPVLYLLVFAVLAMCAREEASFKKRGRGNRGRGGATTAALAVAGTLLFLPFTTRPVRADVVALDALKISIAGDFETAKPKFERALEINPGAVINRYRLIVAAFNQGSATVSSEFALETASLYRYLPSVSIEIAYYLASVGAFSESIEVMERTVAADPLAPVLKTQAADLFIQIGDIFAAREDGSDQAAAAYSLAVDYAPNYPLAVQKLASLDGS